MLRLAIALFLARRFTRRAVRTTWVRDPHFAHPITMKELR